MQQEAGLVARGEGFRSFPMPYPVRFVILGGGNFGLALSHVLARNGIPTTLLLRKQSIADHINQVSSSACHSRERSKAYV
jgi:pyruvate/2-oxoglutarate dehydrogenase complex dihydrolipoamide dehydrogenase (E3) component